MKIALIMPGRGQIQSKGLKRVKPWLPSGALYEIAGTTPKGYEIVIWDEFAQGPITEETLPEADLYGISGLSTSRYGAHRVAELVQSRGGKVIAGGMDVTGQFFEGHQQELLKHFNSIVPGRLTTRLWAEILEDSTKGKLKLVYQADPEEPWEFVVPRHDLIDPKLYFAPAAIRTSAGCREACPFCTVNLVLGGRRVVYCKPAEILEAELEILPESKILVDTADALGANYKHTIDVALPILRASGRHWLAELTIKNLLGIDDMDEGRKELITPMAQSGCAVVYIGIESIFSRVSGKSPGRESTEEAIRRAHDSGLLVLGSIILDVAGNETEDSIKETVEWVITQKLDFVQYSLLGLLPGSQTRRIALQQGTIIDDDPEHLDCAWPTIAHPLSPEQRIELLQWAYRETYSFSNSFRRLARVACVRFSRLVVAAAANYLIRKSVKSWEKRIREDAPQFTVA